jgi:hypothetical protein
MAQPNFPQLTHHLTGVVEQIGLVPNMPALVNNQELIANLQQQHNETLAQRDQHHAAIIAQRELQHGAIIARLDAIQAG